MSDALRPESNVAHLPVARTVYGLVTVLAVLEGMQLHPPTTAWAGAAILFGTTLAVALVEAYSDSIAEMIVEERGLSWAHLRNILRSATPVLAGAQLPTIWLVVAAVGLISLERAIDLAQLTAFASLFAFGWRIAVVLHAQRSRQLLSGLVLVAIGAVLVAFKAAFH